jgi:hypothetical protein
MFPEWFGTGHAVLEKRDMSAETVFEAAMMNCQQGGRRTAYYLAIAPRVTQLNGDRTLLVEHSAIVTPIVGATL